MKLYRPIFLALIISGAFSLNAENQTNSAPFSGDRDWEHHDRDREHHRERCELKGTYAYEISGFIGPSSPATVSLNEAGSLSFDGRGQGTGRGVSAISVAPYRLDPVYNFSYTWLSPFVALASGTRSDALGTYNVQAIVGVGDQAEHISLLLLPNSVASTVIPQSYLNFVQVSGNGGK
jgi:hypothetical protein